MGELKKKKDQQKLDHPQPAEKEVSQAEKQRYEKRLEEELKIITNMGFADYFLIVYDFVHWAKKEGIPVGPGTGIRS